MFRVMGTSLRISKPLFYKSGFELFSEQAKLQISIDVFDTSSLAAKLKFCLGRPQEIDFLHVQSMLLLWCLFHQRAMSGPSSKGKPSHEPTNWMGKKINKNIIFSLIDTSCDRRRKILHELTHTICADPCRSFFILHQSPKARPSSCRRRHIFFF